MKLSIVIPVHNEAATLAKVVERVMATPYEKEILIVDDASTDGSREMLPSYAEDGKIKVFYHEKNQGKGAAIRTALGSATGDIVLIQDADLEYDPAEYPALLDPILRGDADVVFSSRLSAGKAQRVYLFWHKLGNRFLTFLTNFLYNATLTDMESGYKAFRREVFERIRIRSNDFAVEPELAAKVFKAKRWRVYEVPISYYGRTYAEGKKITWKDGFKALWALVKYRFAD